MKQQLDDAQRHAQAQLLMLHTTDESFLELLFGSNGRWCEVSTYEGMQVRVGFGRAEIGLASSATAPMLAGTAVGIMHPIGTKKCLIVGGRVK